MSIERVLRLASFALLLPLTAFAHDSRVAPAATTVVIDGATLETITNGRIENGRIRIEAGKIVAIGGDEVSLAEARVIDALMTDGRWDLKFLGGAGRLRGGDRGVSRAGAVRIVLGTWAELADRAAPIRFRVFVR